MNFTTKRNRPSRPRLAEMLALLVLCAVPCQGDSSGYMTAFYFNASSYTGAEGSSISCTVNRHAVWTGCLFGCDWFPSQAASVTLALIPNGTSPFSQSDVGSGWTWRGGYWDRSVTIAANQTSATFTIPLNDNSSPEYDRTANLRIWSGGIADSNVIQSASTTLLDNDITNHIAVASGGEVVLEGGQQGANSTFMYIWRDYSVGTRTVNYTFGGTATKGTDYTTAMTGSVTMPDGTNLVVLPMIYAQADSLNEGSETIAVTLTNGIYAISTNDRTATVTILDDYPTVSIYSNAVNMLEGVGSASYTIYRTPYYDGVSAAKTINYLVGGTATKGVDYTPSLSGTVTIPAGAGSVTITIYPQADTLNEGTETAILTLTNGVYTINSTNRSASIALLDDFPVVTVAAATNQLAEGWSMGVTFWRDPQTCYVGEPNKTINFHVSGTASNGQDFTFPSTAVITSGQCFVSLPLTNLTDNLVEGVENLTVTIDPGVYTIGNPGTLTVNLPDDYATVNIANKPDFAAELGPIPSKITLARTGNLTRSVTARYQVSGTAVGGTHYQALPGTATFNPGQLSLDIWVTPINDGVYEAPRTVVLSMQPDPSYVLGITTQATVSVIGLIPDDGRNPIIGTRYYRAEPHPATVLSSLYIYWDDLSFVLPLDGEVGVPFDEVNGLLATNFVNRTWTDTRYHIDWLNKLLEYSQTNINNRVAFNNPVVAFGGGHGGAPLFIGQRYSLGVYAGNPAPGYAPVRISAYWRTNGSYVGEALLAVPNPNDASNWTNYANAGFEKTVEAYGLKTTLRSTPNLDWGTLPGGSFILTHEATALAKDYYFLVEATGYTDGLPMAVTAAGVATASRLYTLEFETRPPWRSFLVDQPNFGGALLPPEYDGKSPADLLMVQASQTNQLPGPALSYTNLNQSPELRSHPLLDQLVSDLRGDPIALANYVHNEIELTDPIGLNDDGSQIEQAVNLGGVNRSALGVYLEGQGSPMEQCSLLVYLLRRANIPASYVFAPSHGLKLLDERLSRLLRTRITLARDEWDKLYTTNQLVSVNYPWVAAYVNGRWVHLFPWLKDHEVIEGLDLRDVLPPDYPDGFTWVRDYVLGRTNLLAFASSTDLTPAYIYPRWLANALQTNSPGLSVDDIGMRWRNRPQYRARWEDFPQPTWLTNAFTAVESLSASAITNVSAALTNVFNMVSVEIFSKANPQRRVGTPLLRMADLCGRKFYVTHVTNGSGHQLQLTLGALGTNTNGVGSFADSDLLRRQQLTLALDGTDDEMTVRLVHNQHRAITMETPLVPAPFLGLLETRVFAQESKLHKGDLAAICFSTGRVTKKMLDIQARELWQSEKSINAGGTPDPDIYNGTLVYLMGMSYFERASRADQFLLDLTKVQILSRSWIGLASFAAARDASGQVSGIPDFTRPYVDVFSFEMATIGNGTARPDSGLPREAALRDYRVLTTAALSAEEHQTLNVFLKETNSVSTVRLLQLAQARATNGNPGVITLNSANVNSEGAKTYFGKLLRDHDPALWSALIDRFNNTSDQGQVLAFITPGPVTNASGSFGGMAFMCFGYGSSSATIGNNLNGAYASTLDPGALGPDNAGNILCRQDAGGNYFSILDAVGAGNRTLAPDSIFGIDRDNIASAAQNGYYLTTEAQTLQSLLALNNGLIPGAAGNPYGTLFGQTVQADYDRGDAGSLGFFEKLWGTVADPVSPITGEFYHDAVDLSLPGPFPLQLRRNYSSQNLADNQFGHGWKLNYLPFLSVNLDNTVIYAAEMDGSTLAYERQGGSNFWKVTAARNPMLDNNSRDGIGATANLLRQYLVLTNSTYTLYGSDGSIRIYQLAPFANAPANKPFLMRWQDNRGNFLTFDYVTDSSQPDFAELRRVQASNGNALGLYYDAAAHIVEAYTGDGRRVKFDYDEFGDLVTVTRPDNSEISFEYEHRWQNVTNGSAVATLPYSTHLLVKEVKPDGRLLINQYDNQRRVTNQSATVGPDLRPVRNATFVYNNGFNLTNSPTSGIAGTTTIYDVNNNPTVYGYTNSLITNIVDALGIGLAQIWWQPGESNQVGYYQRSLKRTIDRRGLVTDFYYDANGNVVSNVLRGDLTGNADTGEQAVTTTTYNASNLPLDVTGPATNTTRMVYDTTFPWLPKQVIRLAGSTPLSTNWLAYYSVTNTVSYGGVTYTNLACGLLRQEIRAYGTSDAATNEWSHDGRGFVTQSTRYTGTADPAVTLTLVHNDRGEVVEQQNAANRITRFTYDGMGRQQSREVFDESGQRVAWELAYYNENGELTWSDGPRFDPEDYVWRDYDGAGRQTQVLRWRTGGMMDGSGVAQFAGDDGYAAAWNEFDTFGNLKRAINSRGVIATNIWDSIGRLVQRKVLETNNAILTSEGFAYEPGGLVHYHTNALNAYSETLYTSTGKPRYRLNEDGSTNAWRYNKDGRLWREVQRNGAYWETSYDDANRTVKRVFYSSTSTALATNSTVQDRRGNVIQSTDAAFNTFTNLYDDLDRLKFNAGPAVTSISGGGAPGPGGGQTQPTTNILQHITGVAYDAGAKVLTVTNALGEKTVTTRDALARTVSVQTYASNSATPLRVTTTAYAANHHGATVTEGTGANAISSTTFTDNDGHTVLSVRSPASGKLEYALSTYDSDGNRLESDRLSSEGGQIYIWAFDQWSYDGLNRVRTETTRDWAMTSLAYDALGGLTNRLMPGNLNWSATYANSGQILSEQDSSAGQTTRNTTYTYYPSGDKWAGLLKTATDGRSVTRTNTYDDFLRLAGVTTSGALPEQQIQTSWQYDARGLPTYASQSYKTNATGDATAVQRQYDSYGQLKSETVSVGGTAQPPVTQGWDVAGRRTQVSGFGSTINSQFQADGRMVAVNGGAFAYADNGLLNARTNSFRSWTVTQRDAAGRPLQATTRVAGQTALSETWTWTSDGLAATYVAGRTNDFTDTRTFDYGSLHRRLTSETFNLGNGQAVTNAYSFDQGQSARIGVLTSAGQSGSLSASWNVASTNQDAFQRVKGERATVLRRIAKGTVNGPAALRANLNGRPVDLHYNPATGGNWSGEVGLTTGTNTLALYADHPFGRFTTNATSTFTVSADAADVMNTMFDAGGYVTNRVWKDSQNQTLRTQTLTWDAFGRLAKVAERDAVNSGYNWQADFDPLGRRVRTVTVPVTNNANLNSQQRTLNHVYDPKVEFLEISVTLNGTATLKTYGPDLDGTYGGQQGLGGLESLSTGNVTVGAIHDAFGNVLGAVTNGTMKWNAARVSLYGPAEGYPAISLSTAPLTAEHLGWRGKWRDETGLYYWGVRPYDAERRSFMAFDTFGHSATPDGYSAYNGNPAGYWDADARFGKEAWGYGSGLVEGAGIGAWNEVVGAGKFAKAITFDLGQQISLTGFDAYDAYTGSERDYQSAIFRGTYGMALEGKSNWEMAGEAGLQVSGYRFGNQIDANLQYGAETGDYSQFSQNMGTVAAIAGGPKAMQAAGDIRIPIPGEGGVDMINPADLRWSQTTAGGGGRAAGIRESMAERGWAGDPIDVVQTKDGLATLDHTRPAVALEQGITEIPARIHAPNDPLPADMLSRPWNRAGETATTWGEALRLRGAGQTPPIGPTGSPIPPRLPGSR